MPASFLTNIYPQYCIIIGKNRVILHKNIQGRFAVDGGASLFFIIKYNDFLL